VPLGKGKAAAGMSQNSKTSLADAPSVAISKSIQSPRTNKYSSKQTFENSSDDVDDLFADEPIRSVAQQKKINRYEDSSFDDSLSSAGSPIKIPKRIQNLYKY